METTIIDYENGYLYKKLLKASDQNPFGRLRPINFRTP